MIPTMTVIPTMEERIVAVYAWKVIPSVVESLDSLVPTTWYALMTQVMTAIQKKEERIVVVSVFSKVATVSWAVDAQMISSASLLLPDVLPVTAFA